jgi:exosortase/archaeosortase family protein
MRFARRCVFEAALVRPQGITRQRGGANQVEIACARLLPLAAAVFAVFAPMGRWLWGRWFSTGGEALNGCLFFLIMALAAARIATLPKDADYSPFSGLAASIFFIVSGAFASRFIPRLAGAAMAFSAIYWAIVSSLPRGERERSSALWALILLSLPYEPSFQFVFGYPLRRAAAVLSALVLPGVRAVGLSLSNGEMEVFVDAPCAGAGFVSGMLFLASGAALIFGLNWLRTACALMVGIFCAIASNALRAALLFAGYSGLLPVKFHRYESAIGLACFAVSGISLALAASRLGGKRARVSGKRREFSPLRSRRRSYAMAALFFALCAISLVPGASRGGGMAVVGPRAKAAWPAAWEGRALFPAPPDESTEFFMRSFPGEFKEFFAIGESGAEDGYFPETERIVMRFVREATRQLHPAEDCFKGAGWKIAPAPLHVDRNGRRWSAFFAEKPGYGVAVRQCVISIPGDGLPSAEASAVSWPDVSSWYWDVARPGAEHPPSALAVTVVREL